MNQFMGSGYLAADVTFSNAGGKIVANMTAYVESSSSTEKNFPLKLEVWGKTATFVQSMYNKGSFRKGGYVVYNGELRRKKNSYNGVEKETFVVNVSRIECIGWKKAEERPKEVPETGTWYKPQACDETVKNPYVTYIPE